MQTAAVTADNQFTAGEWPPSNNWNITPTSRNNNNNLWQLFTNSGRTA